MKLALASTLVSFALLSPPHAGASGGGDIVGPPTGCTNTGTQWEDMKFSVAGIQSCPSITFELTINLTGVGGAITTEFHGCPETLVIVPGFHKKVQKLHFNAFHPQPVPWTRLFYEAHCGSWFTSPKCTLKSSEELDRYATTWEEAACDFPDPPPLD